MYIALLCLCQLIGFCDYSLRICSDVFLGNSTGLGKGEWLLSVPVVAGGGDGESGIWVDKWILRGRLLLGKS